MKDGNLERPNVGRIVWRIDRPSPEAVAALGACYAAFLLDHIGKHGAMSGILPLSPGMKVCGPAVTCLGADRLVKRMAVDLAQPGDVLVLAVNGVQDHAFFGDGSATALKLRGMAGIVIDGATRDTAIVRELGVPTFCLGVVNRNNSAPEIPGMPQAFESVAERGGVNVPVVCGRVLTYPGDVIVGDDDGVIVVPRLIAKELGQRARTNLKTERARRGAMTAYEPFRLEEEFARLGYEFE